MKTSIKPWAQWTALALWCMIPLDADLQLNSSGLHQAPAPYESKRPFHLDLNVVLPSTNLPKPKDEPQGRYLRQSRIKVQDTELIVRLVDDKVSPCLVIDQNDIFRRFWISQFERFENKELES